MHKLMDIRRILFVSVLLLPNSYMGLGVADHKVEPEQYESLRQLWYLWQEEN